ncbi:MAG: hypothetical protein IJ033_04820 [Clostridia bacterium]|nr:hypothetical protein [Clostridia bacterium]
MKIYRFLLSLLLILAIAFVIVGLCSCDFVKDDEPFDGYSDVKNVEYDLNFISIDRAKELFANSFNPLMPNYEFLKNSRYESMFKSGTLGDALLETQYNYYLSINNPSKKYLSEKAIYEAYTLSIATPTIWDEPDFYGLEAEDLTGFNHKAVWFDYDYFYEKLRGVEDREANAQAFADYSASYNFALGANEMPHYYVFYPTTSRVSFVTFNAYSDSIKSDYANHKYPRNLELINSSDPNVKSTTTTFEHDGITVSLHIIEEKKVCDFYVQFSDVLFPNGIEDSELLYSYEDGCYLETICSADLRIDGVNYTITYPLMNRLITYDSTDFGSVESSDYSKLVRVAQKATRSFIDDLI